MTDRAIVSFFKREAPSINITEELLTNPSNKIDELIQAYYFLCELILDDMSVDPADEKYPEHMARPHFIVKTREAMNLIFNNIYNGSDEFCYTDLLEPDPRRTRNLLNQMIRFYNFKCEIAKDFTKIDNDIEDQCRSVSFEKQLEKKANEQLDRIKEELHEFEAASKTLEQKELGLRQKLNEEKGKKDMERKNCEGIQERLQEMEERIEVTKRKIFELEEAGRRLEMNIVNSPDRIIGELENLKLERVNMLQKMNSTLQEGRRLDREMAICTTVAQCFASLAEDIKRMETAQDQMLGFRAIEDKRKQELNELEKQRKTLMQELKELEGKYENKMRDLQNEVQISRKEIEAIRQQRNQLENDEKEMAKRLTNVKETIRQHQQKIKRIDRQFLIASDNYDNSVQKMLKDGEKMKTMIDEQQKMLDKIVEKATSILD